MIVADIHWISMDVQWTANTPVFYWLWSVQLFTIWYMVVFHAMDGVWHFNFWSGRNPKHGFYLNYLSQAHTERLQLQVKTLINTSIRYNLHNCSHSSKNITNTTTVMPLSFFFLNKWCLETNTPNLSVHACTCLWATEVQGKFHSLLGTCRQVTLDVMRPSSSEAHTISSLSPLWTVPMHAWHNNNFFFFLKNKYLI